MRYLPALVVASVALVAVTGCEERSNMRALTDRQGHAYVTDSARADLIARSYEVGENEQAYTVVKGDNLKNLIGRFGGDLHDDYIVRNKLESSELTPGQIIIVPKKAAPAPAPK